MSNETLSLPAPPLSDERQVRCLICRQEFIAYPGIRRCSLCTHRINFHSPDRPFILVALTASNKHMCPPPGSISTSDGFFRCTVPDNCQLRPGTKLIFNLLPRGNSFRIDTIVIIPVLDNNFDIECHTPLHCIFKCEYHPGAQSKTLFNDQKLFITTDYLCLKWESDNEDYLKGGGVVKMLLRRIGDSFAIDEFETDYIPNLELEE